MKIDLEMLSDLVSLEAVARQALHDFAAAPSIDTWRKYTYAAIKRDRTEQAIVKDIIGLQWEDE